MTDRGGEDYLGDGLYAGFDGFHLWLRAPRDNGDHEVAIEPATMEWLVRYVAGLRDRFPGQKVPVWEVLKATVAIEAAKEEAERGGE